MQVYKYIFIVTGYGHFFKYLVQTFCKFQVINDPSVIGLIKYNDKSRGECLNSGIPENVLSPTLAITYFLKTRNWNDDVDIWNNYSIFTAHETFINMGINVLQKRLGLLFCTYDLYLILLCYFVMLYYFICTFNEKKNERKLYSYFFLFCFRTLTFKGGLKNVIFRWF